MVCVRKTVFSTNGAGFRVLDTSLKLHIYDNSFYFTLKASLFHSPTLSHHTPLHLYIHYSPIWNSFPSPSCKHIKFIFNHLTCRSPARLSHSLPFPQTVCAEIMPIFILYYDICILYLVCNYLFFTWGVILTLLGYTQFSSVQSLSRVLLFGTPWITACQASLSVTNSHSSLKLMSIKLVMPSSHLILCRPLLLLPPIPPSIRVFSNESTLHMRWPKYWSCSFSISPSNEHPGLIPFRTGWTSLQSKGLSRVFSNTTVQKHEFFSAQLSSQSN